MLISDWSSDVCSSDLDEDNPFSCFARLGPGVFRTVIRGGQHQYRGPEGAGNASGRGAGEGPGDHCAPPVQIQGRPEEGRRSEERREGKECVSTCRSWWSSEP